MTTKIYGMLPLLLLSLIASFACNNNSTQPAPETSSSSSAPASSAKHYQLKGKVVSIDKQGKMANIDSDAIPGFMDAMTMPYTIKPESELDQLKPGDQITGDLIVQGDDSWLENVAVTGHQSAAASKK